ncbi:helix-turn-helix transcriptional regulator [Nonomuraea africana]|uniref:helix-turn-helix transcriptional regulator n=1 Tax=Nonomuraea africana TaxID=46171 RepID=UPI001788EB8F
MRELRKLAGRTQVEVAQAAGLDRSFYGAVEAGKRNIGLDNVFLIAAALGVKTEALFSSGEVARHSCRASVGEVRPATSESPAAASSVQAP